jgi:hypothetical protein
LSQTLRDFFRLAEVWVRKPYRVGVDDADFVAAASRIEQNVLGRLMYGQRELFTATCSGGSSMHFRTRRTRCSCLSPSQAVAPRDE